MGEVLVRVLDPMSSSRELLSHVELLDETVVQSDVAYPVHLPLNEFSVTLGNGLWDRYSLSTLYIGMQYRVQIRQVVVV
ncbi:hypothetical protein CEXT_170931 [Caerostris extrusa]|uniref:Uncharacterized protein n=1 Tax=Caerostris extrusa TaxID=172846 RepID=A0AAV4XWM9_CAEEX|nr:hypothetical protein CEXT_170931 [Caerostris extrusa]